MKTGRQMLGETNPADSKPGTIRGDFCVQVGRYIFHIYLLLVIIFFCHYIFSLRNIMHGSDSVESANKEIALWFKEEELVGWQPASKCWVYED